MILSGRVLNNCINANTYSCDTAIQFNEGDAVTAYIQLVDLSQISQCEPNGRRYVPADGAILSIHINPLSCGKKIVRPALQPFDGDLSIWSFQILSTDGIRGTQDLRIELLEGNTRRSGVIRNGISAQASNAGFEKF